MDLRGNAEQRTKTTIDRTRCGAGRGLGLEAREVKRLNCNIKILLTSGYAGDALERLRPESEFPIIDKPFQLADLAQRLRSILDDA